MKNSYYSMLNQRIRQMKADGKYVIDREELAKLIDLSDEDPEEKDTVLANFMASVMLNQNNFRSVIKGRGVYIDAEAVRNRTIAEMLINNADQDVKCRLAVAQGLEKLLDGMPDDEFRQMEVCFIDANEYLYGERMSKQELIELIKSLQG